MRRKNKNVNRFVLFVIAISGIIVLFYFIIMIVDGYYIGTPVDMEYTGQFGDYFGGVIGTIFSGAAFWLLYLTLKQQIAAESKSNFDSQFSKMLTISQQNLHNITYDAIRLLPNKDKLYIEPKEYVGKDVFQIFFYQFITCKNELKPILDKSSKIYTDEYEKKVNSLQLVRERNINIYNLAKIDICYSIVFYGVDSDGSRILRALFKDRYKDAIVDKIIKYISLKPAFDKAINKRWSQFESFTSPQNLIKHVYDIYEWREKQTHVGYMPQFPHLSIGYRSNFVKYYSGFHQIFGHYFRLNYQLIKYVDSNDNLTDSQKYEMIKLVRCQMSSYEQIVLFLNSLSSMGRSWEIDSNDENGSSGNYNLITRYQLIKNIPIKILFGINVKDYYPNIDFELFD